MNKYLKIAIGTVIGAAAGYAYYYFIGCGSGTCPLTSNWHTSTLYGAVLGLIIAFPVRRKQIKVENHGTESDN